MGLYTALYSIGFRVITRSSASWQFVRRQLVRGVIIVYVFWLIAGMISVVRDIIFPDIFNRSIFYTIPEDQIERVKFTWVAGSILGAIIGGFVSVTYCLYKLRIDWRKRLQNIE